MATTNNYQVGRVRIKLAQLLEEKIPDLEVDPANLNSQIPVYASAQWDCCRWYGHGKVNGLTVNFASWDTMTQCCKGIEITKEDGWGYEISRIS